MIPQWTSGGILPPYTGENPTPQALMSPYQASASEVIARYATSDDRKLILRGWLRYREDLRNVGIAAGFQWLDGSFTEDCESVRSRSPDDLDLVTFAERPPEITDAASFQAALIERPEMRALFIPLVAKQQYLCHAFFVDLTIPSHILVDQARYWFGLFSHQKITESWKGMIRIPLESDDEHALELLG